MVDRVTCTLDIGGRVTPAAIARLSEAMEDEQPEEMNGDLIVEGLIIASTFGFVEMPEGALPEKLGAALIAGGFAFAWASEPSFTVVPSVVLHNPATGETAHYDTVRGEIALAGDAVTDEVAIADAIRWSAFHQSLPPLEILNTDAERTR